MIAWYKELIQRELVSGLPVARSVLVRVLF